MIEGGRGVCRMSGFISSLLKKRHSPTVEEEASQMKFGLARVFKYEELKKATNSFNTELGKGGYGKVYFGVKHVGRGVLSVTVISAEDLPPMNVMGKADPYIVLRMKNMETKIKTRVVNDSLNPVWNQTFDLIVEDPLHDMLTLEVWDHDTFGKDYMGGCIVTLTRVLMENKYHDSLPLVGAKSAKDTIESPEVPMLPETDVPMLPEMDLLRSYPVR